MNPLSFILGLFSKGGKTNFGNIVSLLLLLTTVVGFFVAKKQMAANQMAVNNELAKNAVLVEENETLSSKYTLQMSENDLQKLANDSLQNTTKKLIKDRRELVSQVTILRLNPPTRTVVETTLVDSALVGKCSTNVDIYQKPYKLTGLYWCGGHSFTLGADLLKLTQVSVYNKWGVTRTYVEVDSGSGWAVDGINSVSLPPQGGWIKNLKYVFGIGGNKNTYGVIGGIGYKRVELLSNLEYNKLRKEVEGKLYITKEF